MVTLITPSIEERRVSPVSPVRSPHGIWLPGLCLLLHSAVPQPHSRQAGQLGAHVRNPRPPVSELYHRVCRAFARFSGLCIFNAQILPSPLKKFFKKPQNQKSKRTERKHLVSQCQGKGNWGDKNRGINTL